MGFSFDLLPDELQLKVVAEVDVTTMDGLADLGNLSLTCGKLQTITDPILKERLHTFTAGYEFDTAYNVANEDRLHDDTKARELLQSSHHYLRAIVRCPKLARSVECAIINSQKRWYEHGAPAPGLDGIDRDPIEDQHIFKKALQRVGIPYSADKNNARGRGSQWIAGLNGGNRHTYEALILLLLPNIGTLKVIGSNGSIHNAVYYAASSFRNLEEVHCRHTQPEDSYRGSKFDDFKFFFLLPSVKRIIGHSPYDDDPTPWDGGHVMFRHRVGQELETKWPT